MVRLTLMRRAWPRFLLGWWAATGCAAQPSATPLSPEAPAPVARTSPAPQTAYQGYSGTVVDVIQTYRAEVAVAKEAYEGMRRRLDMARTPAEKAALHVQMGDRFDIPGRRLSSTQAPHLTLFTAEQEDALQRAANSGNPMLINKAAVIRAKVQQAWTHTRIVELQAAAEIVAYHFGEALNLAQSHGLKDVPVDRIRLRLQDVRAQLEVPLPPKPQIDREPVPVPETDPDADPDSDSDADSEPELSAPDAGTVES